MPYHHYVSAFHLAEFTLERSRDGRLFVLDLENGRQWSTSVNRAGGEQGYNAVRGVAGLDPEAIERLIGHHEAGAAPVLREVNDTLALPTGAAVDSLLQYVALLSANNPARRAAMNESQERMLFFMAQMLVSRPETFESAQAECRRDGVPLLGELSYEELCSLLESGRFSFAMSNLAHLRGLGNLVDAVASMLRERAWSLLVARPDAPDFISGDRPVVLTWTAEKSAELQALAQSEPIFPPGYLATQSEVVVPLGRRVALLGIFGGEARRIQAAPIVVAEVNRRALRHASRFVYSAEATFIYRNARDLICDSSAFLQNEPADP